MLGVVSALLWYLLALVAPGTAVRRLVAALGSRNEDKKTSAYMLLVKLGSRAAPHLLEAAREGRETASVLQVLGDLGDRELVSELEVFAGSDDPTVAAAARESMDALLEEEESS